MVLSRVSLGLKLGFWGSGWVRSELKVSRALERVRC